MQRWVMQALEMLVLDHFPDGEDGDTDGRGAEDNPLSGSLFEQLPLRVTPGMPGPRCTAAKERSWLKTSDAS